MMTLHQECRFTRIMSYRDMMLAGDESDLLYLSSLETMRGLYDVSSWEADTFEMCCRGADSREGQVRKGKMSVAEQPHGHV